MATTNPNLLPLPTTSGGPAPKDLVINRSSSTDEPNINRRPSPRGTSSSSSPSLMILPKPPSSSSPAPSNPTPTTNASSNSPPTSVPSSSSQPIVASVGAAAAVPQQQQQQPPPPLYAVPTAAGTNHHHLLPPFAFLPHPSAVLPQPTPLHNSPAAPVAQTHTAAAPFPATRPSSTTNTAVAATASSNNSTGPTHPPPHPPRPPSFYRWTPAFFRNKKLRSGKWTSEEEAYTDRLIELFEKGLCTDCEAGVTLRSYLSQKLHCAPMRISKKFAGQGIGKMVYKQQQQQQQSQTQMTPAPDATQLLHLKEATRAAEANFYRAVSVDLDFMGQQLWTVPGAASPGLVVAPVVHAAAAAAAVGGAPAPPFVLPSGTLLTVPPVTATTAPATATTPVAASANSSPVPATSQPPTAPTSTSAVGASSPPAVPQLVPPHPPLQLVSALQAAMVAPQPHQPAHHPPFPSAASPGVPIPPQPLPNAPAFVTAATAAAAAIPSTLVPPVPQAVPAPPLASQPTAHLDGTAYLHAAAAAAATAAVAPHLAAGVVAPGLVVPPPQNPVPTLAQVPLAATLPLAPRVPGPLPPPPVQLPTSRRNSATSAKAASPPLVNGSVAAPAAQTESDAQDKPTGHVPTLSAAKPVEAPLPSGDATLDHAHNHLQNHHHTDDLPDFLSGFDRVALKLKAEKGEEEAPQNGETVLTDLQVPNMTKETLASLQCSPPLTSRSFDEFHRLGLELVPLTETAETATTTSAAAAAPESSSAVAAASAPEPPVPQNPAQNGAAGFDTTALFTPESYSVFAQESATAALNHSAYSPKLDDHTNTHGALLEPPSKKNRAHSFDVEGMVKLVSKVVPGVPPRNQAAVAPRTTTFGRVVGDQGTIHNNASTTTGATLAPLDVESAAADSSGKRKRNDMETVVQMHQQQHSSHHSSPIPSQVVNGSAATLAGTGFVVSETSATETERASSGSSEESGSSSNMDDDESGEWAAGSATIGNLSRLL